MKRVVKFTHHGPVRCPLITFYDNFENIAALHPLMIESFISSNFWVLRFIGKDKEFKGAEISNAKRFLNRV